MTYKLRLQHSWTENGKNGLRINSKWQQWTGAFINRYINLSGCTKAFPEQVLFCKLLSVDLLYCCYSWHVRVANIVNKDLSKKKKKYNILEDMGQNNSSNQKKKKSKINE